MMFKKEPKIEVSGLERILIRYRYVQVKNLLLKEFEVIFPALRQD